MLVASPLAGVYADRHGSRALAAIGMLVTRQRPRRDDDAAGHSPYWQSALWLALVGVGSGMFNSPNTAAMMGVVPANRRGVAAGARTLLQNTGAVLSIAFVLAIVTSAVPKATLFAVFSGLAKGLSAEKLAPFIANMHIALWVLAAVSLLGAFVCLLRPRTRRRPAEDRGPRRATATSSSAESQGGTHEHPAVHANSRERAARAACASATSPGWSARRRARSATTRRSACWPRPPRAPPASTASTPARRSSACAR